jgi:hypothetical protein
VSEAPGVVSDGEIINTYLGEQEAQEIEGATDFVMDDVEIKKNVKMNDD